MQNRIETEPGTPSWHVVADRLEEDIRAGVFPLDSELPGPDALVEAYGFPRNAVLLARRTMLAEKIFKQRYKGAPYVVVRIPEEE